MRRRRKKTPPCQSIIPPIILDEIEARGDEAEKVAARRTKATTAAIQAKREQKPVEPEEGEKREVYDAHERTDLPGEIVRSEDDPASDDEDVDAAYDGLGATFAYLKRVEARDSLDGQGLPLIASVHYDRNYDNAMWDGAQMVFGDGHVFASFARSLSVVAHELGHGVVQYTAKLIYRDQPGALNEHWADVMGALVDQRQRGQSAVEADWLIGRELMHGGLRGKALRSMIEPGTAYDDPLIGRDSQPNHMSRYVMGRGDNGGVHSNSGIPNRAFALACVERGGPAWEEVGRVWYHALTTTLPRVRPSFQQAATATVASATALYGAHSLVEQAVRRGWATVGVPVEAAEGPPPPEPPRGPCTLLGVGADFLDALQADAEAVALLQQVAARPSVQRAMVRVARALRPEEPA